MLVPATESSPIAIDLHRIRQSDYTGSAGTSTCRWWATFFRSSRRIQAFQLYLVTPWFPM
jgi:hypothetical protein